MTIMNNNTKLLLTRREQALQVLLTTMLTAKKQYLIPFFKLIDFSQSAFQLHGAGCG